MQRKLGMADTGCETHVEQTYRPKSLLPDSILFSSARFSSNTLESWIGETQGQRGGYGDMLVFFFFTINNPREGTLVLLHNFRGFIKSWWGEHIREGHFTLWHPGSRERDIQEGLSEIYGLWGRTPVTHLFWGSPISYLSPLLIKSPLYESIKGLIHSLGHCSHDLIVSGRSIRETQRGVLH